MAGARPQTMTGVDQGSDKYEKGSSSSEKFPVVYGEEMIENIVL